MECTNRAKTRMIFCACANEAESVHARRHIFWAADIMVEVYNSYRGVRNFNP